MTPDWQVSMWKCRNNCYEAIDVLKFPCIPKVHKTVSVRQLAEASNVRSGRRGLSVFS